MTAGRRGTVLRRATATVLPAVLVAALVSVVTATPALAGEPSVPLSGVRSTPVSQQQAGDRGADPASSGALTGNQPANGSTKDGAGTSKATPLAPSATWNVSAQTGDFSWSYPLRVPPAPGGAAPQLALSYASSSVDGHTSATNNQPSWVGDGWDLSVGFVERTYGACAEDTTGGTTPPKVGDLCWRSDNATASYGGGGGQLIRDDATGGWRAKNDDGARIERLTGTANGDDDGESWRITTTDGTQYLFGSRPEAKSTWTVPVFGDDAGEPCHAATFDASHCVQAWRWNLDRVVDPHGNVTLYGYDTETNSYGLNKKTTAVPYVRAGSLRSVEYGLRDGSTEPAAAKVDFTTADRCVPGSDCTPDKKENWPDVAWDDKCDTATCVDHESPTFWSTKRLAKVTTKVRSGSGYSDVESWSFDQQYPKPGDGEKAALWLKGISHTGLAGTPVELPPVTFEGAPMANRVDKVDGLGPLLRYRVTGIVSETGGVTSVVYAAPDCADGSLPANAETNTKRCFPMRWAKKDFSERTDYFHKYVVAQVVQSDRISANTEQVTAYEYVGGAAWAYDTSEFTKDDKRTWNDFRGFGTVLIRQGEPDDPSGPITMTEQRFYRGMDGDKQPSGTRSVSVTDSEGVARKDDDQLGGFAFETQTRDGESDRVVSKTITTPTVQGPTATRGILKAYIVKPGVTTNYTTVGIGRRTTRQETAYDDRGQVVTTNDLGDVSTPADDKCTRTTIVRNTERWLIADPARVETVAVACTATPSFPADALSDTRFAYDGKGFGAAPDQGDVTRTEVLDQRPASGPVYSLESTTGYDALGRVTSTGDALGRTATTSYVPPAGGPLTKTVATNPLGHAVTTTVEPAFGQPTTQVDANGRTTETTYDALGRKTEVWLSNRPRATNAQGNQRFGYTYRNDGPTVVTTTSVGPNGNFTSGNEIYDGLLRLRQTQTPASGGGRLIVDTRYDSHGRAYKTTMPYFTDSPVDDRLWVASDVDIPMQTVTEHDGAGRTTAEITKGGANEKWRTSTSYAGDRVNVTPPKGSTPTTIINDAQGRTIELRQYHGSKPEGEYDSTTYTYTPAGQTEKVTDPGGATWTRAYDLHGRQVKDEDPDKGTTTVTFDAAGQLLTSTDAKGVTLVNSYDELGRRTATRTGSATGPKLAEWTYDTVLFGKGLAATSTRFVDGEAYTSSVLGYSALNSPLGNRITVPQREGALAGKYETYSKYTPSGDQESTTYPKIGSLPTETVTHSYNDFGKATKTSGAFGGVTAEYVTDTDYTRYGEVQRVQLGAVGKRVWLSSYYDTNTRELNRTIVDAELPQPMVSDVHYSYDESGNITSIADTPTGKPADVQCFRMDFLQRVTEAWTPTGGCDAAPGVTGLGGPAPYWQSFGYDKVGNRVSETRHAAGGDTVRTSTYPAGGHRLASVATAGPGGTATDRFDYDASGNTIGRNLASGAQRLDWDAEGHLAKVTEGTKTTEFLYDADGDRLIRRDPAGTTLYLDGQEVRLTKATGALDATRYYQHGGATVAMRDAKGLTWLADDHQSTAQVAVASGALDVTTRRQLPFGAPRGGLAAFPGEKGFVGGTTDASTGLTHLGAREYDPQLGRFLSVDPKMDLTDPQQMQGYSYANNSPLTKFDPTGMFWDWIGKKIKSGLDNAAKWVDKNKNWIGVGLNVLGFVPGLGTAAFILGAALTAIDLVQSIEKGDGLSIAFDVAGLGLGFLGRGMVGRAKSMVQNRDKWSPQNWKGVGRTKQDWDQIGEKAKDLEDGAYMWDMYGTGLGAMGALSNDQKNAIERDAYNAVYGPANKSDCTPEGFFGPYPCRFQKVIDPLNNSYCHGPFAQTEACKWLATHPAVNLGPDKPERKAATGGSGRSGKSGGSGTAPAAPTCSPNCYQSSDGMYHRNDGKGRAWF
ncbi:RHS repeat-associated core domain-containing protein [Umezawaea sp. NPDC059074]|uniref:RHS repeat-associated core domain-containing protein n=1 Tax=Umezawaea sp. NPDC059074 TaxID=3346716 RepID=UPI00367F54C6